MTTSAPPRGPRHFNGLDAKTIKTEQLLMTDKAVQACARRNALGLITGPAGRGKTFAVDHAATRLDVPVVRTLFGASTNRKQMARSIIAATTGSKPMVRDTHDLLADECLRLFASPHVIVVDEAQHLNLDCNFFLRFLLDHPATQVSFILIGAEDCREKIERDQMLATRIYRTVEFKDVPIRSMLKALPKYHRVYADADSELLQELAHRFPIDQHRALAAFTMTVVDLCEEDGGDGLTEKNMEQAIYLLGR